MNKIKVVDFYADWCGPCKMMAPAIDQLAKELPNVTFEKVNVDAVESSAKAMGIQSIPTLIIFKDGVEVKRMVGFTTKEKLLKEIAISFEN